MLRFDLIGLKKVKALVRSAVLPYALQTIAFGFFLLLITVGLRTGTTDAFSEEMHEIIVNTNFTALLVARLWWPCIVIVAIVIGRIWCAVENHGENELTWSRGDEMTGITSLMPTSRDVSGGSQ